jgi:hypothetical protein
MPVVIAKTLMPVVIAFDSPRAPLCPPVYACVCVYVVCMCDKCAPGYCIYIKGGGGCACVCVCVCATLTQFVKPPVQIFKFKTNLPAGRQR